MKNLWDGILAVGAVLAIGCIILGNMHSNSDCGNAKVVRGVEYIEVNQDSITEAEYHRKADSMTAAIKARVNRNIP